MRHRYWDEHSSLGLINQKVMKIFSLAVEN
jgi:hypothetical protein